MLCADWAITGGPQAGRILRIAVSHCTLRLADSIVQVCC